MLIKIISGKDSVWPYSFRFIDSVSINLFYLLAELSFFFRGQGRSKIGCGVSAWEISFTDFSPKTTKRSTQSKIPKRFKDYTLLSFLHCYTFCSASQTTTTSISTESITSFLNVPNSRDSSGSVSKDQK